MSFVDYKKYHSNKYTYRNIRKISDRLCKENGLSVISPNENRGKSYHEYTAAKQGISWKEQIKADIDKAISRAVDFDDFLLRMEIADYEVKQGKYIAFRLKGKERFTRGKTLGERYTEDSIKKRIERNRVRTAKPQNRRINLIIDIQICMKAQESKGYEHWAKINNLKQASKTINFLTEHNIKTYEELEQAAEKIHTEFETVSEQIKTAERQMNSAAVLMKHTNTYNELKPVYEKYKRAKNKAAFEQKYRREIVLFEAAAKNLKGESKLSADELRQNYDTLTEQKQGLYQQYKTLKKQAAEMDIIKSNVDMILHRPKEKEREQENNL